MRYLLKRGRGALRRKAHLTGYDPLSGQPLMVPLCGDRRTAFDMTSNVPWGRPVCRRCRAALDRLTSEGT